MRKSPRTVAIAGAAFTAIALAGATAGAGPASASVAHHPAKGAVFVQTNGADGNAIVAYDQALHQTGVFATGGKGGILTGAVADPLASQGALTLDRAHHLLYAVNAGSNTITVFGVHGSKLVRLQVIGSGGTFPVSVTTHGGLVYVLNARDGGSVQGFHWAGGRLVAVANWNRRLGLDPAAAPEFTHSPGQVSFSPDGRQVLVTTKANTNEIDSFAIDGSGAPSASPVRNVVDGAVPFALDYDKYGHVVASEAGPNAAATFALNGRGQVKSLATEGTGGAATCWVLGVNGVFYLSNAGSNTVTAFRSAADGSLTKLSTTATDPGTIDVAANVAGSKLYVETGAGTDAITVFSVGHDGALVKSGSVNIPNGADSEGIAAY